MTRFRFLLWLFAVNLRISAFTFGGGYVVIPMIRREFVEKKQLFSEEELMNMAAIAQSSPGAIAINLSVLAGLRAGGIAGAAACCLGAVTPPIVILSLVSLAYVQFRDSRLAAAVLRGMQAGVAAVIVDLVFTMSRAVFRRRHTLSTLLVPGVFIASLLLRVHVGLLLAASAVIAAAEALWTARRAEQ